MYDNEQCTAKFFFFFNLDKTILYITYVLHIINHKS